MEKQKSIRVVEIRAAEDGWVITAMERESMAWNDGMVATYKALVAESAETAAKKVLALMKAESWDRAVDIPPARKGRGA